MGLANGLRVDDGRQVLVVVAWRSYGCDGVCDLRVSQLLQLRQGHGARDELLDLLTAMVEV